MTNVPSSPTSSTPVLPVTTVTSGTLIMDTYEIEKLINSGGMGEVYRGRNIHNGEPVAIKIVLPSLAHDPKIVALFQKESTVLSRLSHEAIVRYHTFTIDRTIGRPCMVMEFVSGTPLGERVDQGPMPLDEVKVMFRRVASGLDKAHRAGVVHRDLSPDNVILEEGSVDHAKLIDFGIAKSASFGGGTLLGGQFAGKFNWVAPEQLGAFGGLVDGRSDIYSLALVIAAASRGKVVAMGDSIVDAVGKRSGVPDLTGVDPELLPLLSYMLQPDPEKRPASMAAVMAALDNPSLVPTVAVPPPPDPNRTIIGGVLPVMQASQPPVAAPVTMAPLPVAPLPVAGDWSVPSSRATAAPTIIASQAPISQPPMAQAEAEDISPFGAPVTPSRVVPPVETAVPAKKRGGGVLAVLGILVVLGAGAGAYFGGLIGPLPGAQTEEQRLAAAEAEALKAIEDARIAAERAAAEAEAKVEADKAEAARIDAEAKAAAAKAEVDAEAAKVAEAAAEAAAKAEAEAQAAAKAKAEADALAASQTEAELAAAKAAELAARQQAEADAAAARAAEEAAAKRASDEAAARAAEAARLAEEQAAAAAKADPAAAQADWLARLSSPTCVRLAPVAGAVPPTMAGFATTTDPLEALAAAYKADLGREADIAPKLINEAQCPVIDFVNRRQTGEVPPLTVRMADGIEVVKTGKKISGVIEGINGRPFMAFLVADGGGITNMTPLVSVGADGIATFSFALGMAAGAPPAPQMLLVMTTDEKVAALEAVPAGVSAKSLVPFMEVALKDNRGPMSLGLGFFRLEN